MGMGPDFFRLPAFCCLQIEKTFWGVRGAFGIIWHHRRNIWDFFTCKGHLELYQLVVNITATIEVNYLNSNIFSEDGVKWVLIKAQDVDQTDTVGQSRLRGHAPLLSYQSNEHNVHSKAFLCPGVVHGGPRVLARIYFIQVSNVLGKCFLSKSVLLSNIRCVMKMFSEGKENVIWCHLPHAFVLV